MAYGLVLLRCTPMVLSAASVNFSYNQYLFLRPYVDLAKQSETAGDETGDAADKGTARSQVNAMLAPYIRQQFPSGLAAILALYPTTWVAAGLSLAAGRSAAAAAATLPRASRCLYAAGLVFSIEHMWHAVWWPMCLAGCALRPPLSWATVSFNLLSLAPLTPLLSLGWQRVTDGTCIQSNAL